jgi:hypothetical protein
LDNFNRFLLEKKNKTIDLKPKKDLEKEAELENQDGWRLGHRIREFMDLQSLQKVLQLNEIHLSSLSVDEYCN